jgi:hypothetical protein
MIAIMETYREMIAILFDTGLRSGNIFIGPAPVVFD